MQAKWPEGKYIVYFQANTNTYAPLEKLKELFSAAAALDPDRRDQHRHRCDALASDTLAYLSELNKRIPVWLKSASKAVTRRRCAVSTLVTTACRLLLSAVDRIRACGIERRSSISSTRLPGKAPK